MYLYSNIEGNDDALNKKCLLQPKYKSILIQLIWEFENQCAILTLYLVNFIFLSTFNKLVLAVSSTKHCKSNVGGCGCL